MRRFLLVCIGLLFMNFASDAQAPRFEQVRCQYDGPRGVTIVCGYLVVPEDRDDPQSEMIRLSVAILQSPNPEPDPVVSLTGGPGGVTTPFLPFVFRENYRDFLQNRDFIMFDQRGVGLSQPSLDCEGLQSHAYGSAAERLTTPQRYELDNEQLIACHAALLERDAALPAYTTSENAADLADLREALGYDEWNLFGVSYGTKLALTTMRDYPDGLRSVILDSTYPLQADLYTEIAVNQQRSFDLLFSTCALDDACSAAYPDLEASFYQVVETLNDDPQLVEGRHSFRGFTFEALVTGDMVANYVFGQLYVKNAIPGVPALINELAEGDYSALSGVAQQLLDQSSNISEGMYYSVQCSEEIAFSDQEAAVASAEILHPSLRPAQIASTNSIFALCDAWRTDPADPAENAPVMSDVPTLVLSGEFDPITPPSWGQLVADDLTNGFFYTLPTVGHGAVRSDDCALSIALQFVDDPTTEPDSSCIEDIPPIAFELP